MAARDCGAVPVFLRPVHLRWIGGVADDPADLCAHGDFEFRIGGDVLSDGKAGRELTLSAAALYLLRTLDSSHTRAAPVADHLFPCCGFAMFEVEGKEDVVIVGCPSGEDFEVEHHADEVTVVSPRGGEWCVRSSDWRAAVYCFADEISHFYGAAAVKRPASDDEPGFRKFCVEWRRRRGQPLDGRVSGPW